MRHSYVFELNSRKMKVDACYESSPCGQQVGDVVYCIMRMQCDRVMAKTLWQTWSGKVGGETGHPPGRRRSFHQKIMTTTRYLSIYLSTPPPPASCRQNGSSYSSFTLYLHERPFRPFSLDTITYRRFLFLYLKPDRIYVWNNLLVIWWLEIQIWSAHSARRPKNLWLDILHAPKWDFVRKLWSEVTNYANEVIMRSFWGH